MIRTFGCPSCGGPLEYKGGSGVTIRCSFCNNHIIVPDELRAPESVPQRLLHNRPAGSRNSYLVIAALVIALGAGIALFVLIAPRTTRPSQLTANVPVPAMPKPAQNTPAQKAAAQESGFASVAMTFGSE